MKQPVKQHLDLIENFDARKRLLESHQLLADACQFALDYLWTDSDQPESGLVIAQLREALNAVR